MLCHFRTIAKNLWRLLAYGLGTGCSRGRYGNEVNIIEWLRERNEHLYIFLFFRPSLNSVLFPMFCLLV